MVFPSASPPFFTDVLAFGTLYQLNIFLRKIVSFSEEVLFALMAFFFFWMPAFLLLYV